MYNTNNNEDQQQKLPGEGNTSARTETDRQTVMRIYVLRQTDRQTDRQADHKWPFCIVDILQDRDHEVLLV